MKTRKLLLVSVVALSLVLPCSPAFAQTTGPDRGGPGGGQDPPTDAFELYGDLYVVLRDTNGEVIRDKNGCARPVYAIGADPAPPQDLPSGLKCALVPLCGDEDGACIVEAKSSTGEVEPCDVWDPYPYMEYPEPDVNPLFDFLQEVDFGRLSVARSPVDVIDHGYLEAVNRLNRAQPLADEFGEPLPNIATDPAGRIHYYALDAETGETGWFTIDAPLENLGLYDRIMKFGTLLRVEYVRVEQTQMFVVEETAPDWDRYVLADELQSLHPCWPGSPDSCDPYDTCDPYSGEGALDNCDSLLNPTGEDILIGASTFAAAGDKTGLFTTDALIHVNTYLGINDLESDPEEYFPYASLLVVPYDRYTQFGSKAPVPLLQPYPEDWTCVAGPGILSDYPCFYVAEVVAYQTANFHDIPHCTDWDTDFFYPGDSDDGPAIDVIFESSLEAMGYDAEHLGQAQQVAQAAEDARAIIWYIHNWAVPALSNP